MHSRLKGIFFTLLQFSRKSSQEMVEFLQSSVGIIHRNHAESITTFIKKSVDEELKEDSSDSDVQKTPKKRLTFCVEGNISVGKTTFLQRIANETLELQDLVEIVPEPIHKWQDVGENHHNVLDAFYAEPHRYAYTFQNYVFVTRVMQERESSGGIKPLRLMERSVFSDRMVGLISFLVFLCIIRVGSGVFNIKHVDTDTSILSTYHFEQSSQNRVKQKIIQYYLLNFCMTEISSLNCGSAFSFSLFY